MPLVQQSHMDPKTLKIRSSLGCQAFNAINQTDLSPQLSCNASKDWTTQTNKHSCSSHGWMDFMVFLSQVHPITLCGTDVHVMLAFGLYGKEGCVFL